MHHHGSVRAQHQGDHQQRWVEVADRSLPCHARRHRFAADAVDRLSEEPFHGHLDHLELSTPRFTSVSLSTPKIASQIWRAIGPALVPPWPASCTSTEITYSGESAGPYETNQASLRSASDSP